jgi:hypothetical protein
MVHITHIKKTQLKNIVSAYRLEINFFFLSTLNFYEKIAN